MAFRSRLLPFAAAALAVFCATDAGAASAEFPAVRPATRAQSVATLSGGGALPLSCLTPAIDAHRGSVSGPTPAAARALALLSGDHLLLGERRFDASGGTVVRYSTVATSFDFIDPLDANRNGRPDAVEEVTLGLREANRLLVRGLGLPTPGPLEVVLASVGGTVDGYTIPASARPGPRTLVVLEVSPESGALDLRKAAIHQFAHAVAAASGPAMTAGWAEALATWTGMTLAGGPDERTAAFFSERLARLAEGMLAEDLALGAGNALWLAFVEASFGETTLSLTVQELASGAPTAVALDRALRRGVGRTLDSAMRDFQLWSVLVGDRDDTRHFAFARQLASPVFAATADGLPVLSVHDDPPVGALGAATVLLRPGEQDGGLTVRFEGELETRWAADLLLVSADGGMHRLPIRLTNEGRGEVTVPLSGLREVLLLARNLDTDVSGASRYTWSAFRHAGFPFEIGSVDAVRVDGPRAGVLVSWDTTTEEGLLGFNVLRIDGETGATSRVNPVWIPAVGSPDRETAYQFLDVGAGSDAAVRYRIEGITPEGLTSRSDPVVPVGLGS